MTAFLVIARSEATKQSGVMIRHLFFAAAAAIFWMHMAVIAFNVAGLVLIPLGAWRYWRFVRNFWLRALHLGALAVVAFQAILGDACFLTIWQSDLLARAGEPTSSEPLIERWVERIVFWNLPIWVFAALYCAVALYTLALWRLVPPIAPRQSPPWHSVWRRVRRNSDRRIS
jgi:hypothetical protein